MKKSTIFGKKQLGMNTIVQTHLSNLQLELLKLFARSVSEDDLLEIKKILTNYFANKAMDEADKVWEDNSWDSESEKRFLDDHLRTPYRR